MEKMKLRRQGRSGVAGLLSILFMIAAAFLFTAGICARSETEVYAASNKAAVSEVKFTDGSGKYLKRSGSKWYLRGSRGEKLTGVQYLSIPAAKPLSRGFYMFDKNGKLLQKRAVYSLKEQTIKGVVFKGYHYTDKNGRFLSRAQGLKYLSGLKCGTATFKGYYYMGDHGRLSAPAQMRYLSAKKIGRVSFAKGYYYFSKTGKLYTKAAFRKVNQKVKGSTFKGDYYFGGKNGALRRKAGWVTVNKKKYYVLSSGKKAVNCWKSGYYLQADGTIARNKKVPDGSYVDASGRRCKQEEVALSGLKQQLKNLTARYGGTWSVYVKNLETGDVLNLNDQAMYPASTIKTFAMASIYDRIANKKLSYNSTIKTLLRNMITVSDNESFNELVRYHSSSHSFISGTAVVNQYLKKNNYTKTRCHSSLHPSASSFMSDGSRNTASAKDCGLLLEKIYNGTCVSAKYSKEMLNLLLAQTRRWKIPAGIPSGIKVANKTGETSAVQHDTAIVFGKKTDYVICVFSTGAGEGSLVSGIQSVSRAVYNYLN